MRTFQGSMSLCVCLLALAGTAAAGSLELATSEQPPPAGLSESVAGALEPARFSVSSGGETRAEFWFVRELDTGGMGGMQLGVNFGTLPLGALLGVVNLAAEWRDYKDSPIPAGLYVLRYGQQPADGNHTGITVYRDYAMLIPVEADEAALEEYSQPRLNESSRRSTGTPHPGIMALFPIWDPVEKPQLLENEIGQPTLVWVAGDLQIGFVVEGHGELEGY